MTKVKKTATKKTTAKKKVPKQGKYQYVVVQSYDGGIISNVIGPFKTAEAAHEQSTWDSGTVKRISEPYNFISNL